MFVTARVHGSTSLTRPLHVFYTIRHVQDVQSRSVTYTCQRWHHVHISRPVTRCCQAPTMDSVSGNVVGPCVGKWPSWLSYTDCCPVTYVCVFVCLFVRVHVGMCVPEGWCVGVCVWMVRNHANESFSGPLIMKQPRHK